MRVLFFIMASLALGSCGAIPDAGQRPVEGRAGPVITTTEREVDRICLTQLDEQKARYTPLPDRYFGEGCATIGTVQLDAIQGDADRFSVSNIGPVACPLAKSFSAWARYGVDRAARQILGSRLVRIETYGSYSCRNIAGSGRRSAHSRAEAIDVAAFVLADGRKITVKDGWQSRSASEKEFLRVIHRSACKRFGTVLGPNYNSAHADHFHLEEGKRRFCR